MSALILALGLLPGLEQAEYVLGPAETSVGLAPLSWKGKSEDLAQWAGLSLAQHLAHQARHGIWPPDKIRGVLSRSGFHASELEPLELAAGVRDLLNLDYLIQGSVERQGRKRSLELYLWDLKTLSVRPLMSQTQEGGFRDFKMDLRQTWLWKFPLEGDVAAQEGDLVSLALGENNGLKLGTMLALYRPSRVYGGKLLLARLKVVDLSAHQSTAKIKEWLHPSIRPPAVSGDRVRVLP